MPKISDACILVSLSISSFSGNKTDRRLTSEVSNANHTRGDALRVVKKIVGKQSLEAIKKIESEARNYHRQNSVAWADDGARMLPSAHHAVYMKTIRGLRQKFEDAAAAFCADWPQIIAQAKLDLNGAFNDTDYPDESTIANHFEFRVKTNPVPDVGDIRVDLPAQEVDAIRRELSERIDEAEKMATNELLKRLAEPLAAMVNKLNDKEAVFRDTLVSNVTDIANLIPALNVTNDPVLDKVRKEIMASIGTVRANDLRDDVFTRQEMAKKAQGILDIMVPTHREAA